MAKEIEFSRLVAQVAANFDEMQNGGGVLYVTDQSNIGNQPLFDTWLDSFKEQKIWRERREHDCDTCRSFIKRIGPVVSLNLSDEGKIVRRTLWEGEELETLVKDTEYENPVRVMRELMRSLPIEKEFIVTREWLNSLHLKSYEAGRTLLVGSPNGKSNIVTYDKENANTKVTYETKYEEVVTSKGKKIMQPHKVKILTPLKNGGRVIPGKQYNFTHFHCLLNPGFIQEESKSACGGFFDIGDTKAGRENKTKDRYRILNELFNLPDSGFLTALELFKSQELWEKDGGEALMSAIIKLREEFKEVPTEERPQWVWYKAHSLGRGMSCFKDNAIYSSIIEPLSELEIRDQAALSKYPSLSGKINKSVGVIRQLLIQKGVVDYNTRVDPAKMNRCSTENANKKNIDAAEKFIVENGYESAFLETSFLTMSDIPTSLVNYKDSSSKTITKAEENSRKSRLLVAFETSTEDQDSVPTTEGVILTSRFKDAKTIDINEFNQKILPDVKSMKVLFPSTLSDRVAVLFTAKDRTAKPIYSWKNNNGWVNITGHSGKSNIVSSVKNSVKKMGAYTDGYMSYSLQFFEEDSRLDRQLRKYDPDAHIIEFDDRFQCKDHIYYGHHNFSLRNPKQEDFIKNRSSMSWSGGVLDHDCRQMEKALDGSDEYIAIENIYYPYKDSIKDGYVAVVANYFAGGHTVKHWKAQVTVGDRTKEYDYSDVTRVNDWILISLLHFKDTELIEWIDGDKLSTFKSKVIKVIDRDGNYKSTYPKPQELVNETNEKVWGLNCGKFHPVSLICPSPNYWESSVGTKYWFFILKGMRIDTELPTINPQFLNNDLKKYRKGIQGIIMRDYEGYKGVPGKKLFCLKPSDTSEQLAGIQIQDGDGEVSLITSVVLNSGRKDVWKITFGNVKAVVNPTIASTTSSDKEVVVRSKSDSLVYFDTVSNTCVSLTSENYLSEFDFILSDDLLKRIEEEEVIRVKPGYEVIKKGDVYFTRKKEEKKN